MANALPHPNLFESFPCVTMDFVGGGGGGGGGGWRAVVQIPRCPERWGTESENGDLVGSPRQLARSCL